MTKSVILLLFLKKQLKVGEYLLSFRQTTQDGKVIIANKSVAINVSGAIKDIPIVAIVDSEGKLGAKVIQAPGLDAKKEINEFFDNVIVNDVDPGIRKNRLELIQILCKTFNNYVNFSLVDSQK